MANSRIKQLCATALFGVLLSTTAVPVVAQDLNQLAGRGEVLAGADSLSAELRSQLDEAGRRGFDIGMGAAEGNTLPGPGKQRIHDSLPVDQQAGYDAAVQFSLTRNANLAAARAGGRIGQTDPRLAQARLGEDDPFFALGFDIATGLLDERAQSGQALFTKGAAGLGVRSTLSGATQRGFDASANFHGSGYAANPAESTAGSIPLGDSAVGDGSAGVDRVGTVPNVAGMTIINAYTTLGQAGFVTSELEINTGPILPPYDRVIGTRPAAGTNLRPASEVTYLVPRAWLQKGDGRLTTEDEDTRLGFDFDTGNYVPVDGGAEIYSTSTIHQSESGRVRTKLLIINVSRNATMVRVSPSGGYAKRDYRDYDDCERGFRNPTPNPGWDVGEFCIVTDGDRTARLTIRPDYSFYYTTFAGRAGTSIRPVGRIYGPDGMRLKSTLTICEAAKGARDRNSPAAPGLAKTCLEQGGTVPQ